MARAAATLPPDSRPPTRLSQLSLGARVAVLRFQRACTDAVHPVPELPVSEPSEYSRCAARVVSRLRSGYSGEERALELGKIQNLRVAARALDGRTVRKGEVFSFWRQVGRCTRRKGYVSGRQLQEGCLVRAVGGGICQLSNALYEVALKAGAEIVERHPHTRIVPGSAAEREMDATVAWNHIDLRWRATEDVLLRVTMSRDSLEVSLWGKGSLANAPAPQQFQLVAKRPLRTILQPKEHACGLCEQTDCHLHGKGTTRSAIERTAYLVDEVWPEFDQYLQSERTSKDLLCLPMARGDRPAYAWSREGWGEVRDAALVTLRRSLAARRLADQGAARQTARLAAAEELAAAYARRLAPEISHLVVTLDLLPFLQRDGHLGGRSYDVLMTRYPIEELQARLDAAYEAYPDRTLLADFRAPGWLVEAEREALAGARRLVTPHRGIAAADRRRWLLDWKMPKPNTWNKGSAIAFAGPTVARKGAYEVREAAMRMGLPVVLLGRNLEGEGFWDGVETRAASASDWLNGVFAVVQLAVIEDRPRRLLQAVAAGCPVVATEACGVSGMPGVSTVDDVEGLVAILGALKDAPATAGYPSL